jgi:hypothetical protein
LHPEILRWRARPASSVTTRCSIEVIPGRVGARVMAGLRK